MKKGVTFEESAESAEDLRLSRKESEAIAARNANEGGGSNLERPNLGMILTAMEHEFIGSTILGKAYHPNLSAALAAGMGLSDLNRFRQEFSEDKDPRNDPDQEVDFIYPDPSRLLLLKVRLLPLSEEDIVSPEPVLRFEILSAKDLTEKNVSVPEDAMERLRANALKSQAAARAQLLEEEVNKPENGS